MMQAVAESSSICVVSDGSKYSITKRPAPRIRAPEKVEQPRTPAEVLPPIALPDPEPTPTFAYGSRPALRVNDLAAAAAGRSLSVKVEFGDVELTIEHRGDEVSLVIPGALRLRAPRAQAMALVAALMKRP
jgi:hypothetical protein